MIMKNTFISKYKLISLLGTGGMSEVYLAHDTRTGTKVAIKILDKKLSKDPEYIKRFKREVEISKTLSHPNIIKIISCGTDKGRYYIVYEYIEGLTLDKYIKSKKLSIKEIEEVTLQILKGLSYAHSKNIIHRDIKPSNIMISKDGMIKILDFGIARATARSTITKTGMFMGSPHYTSPEQIDGKKIDHRTDIYSLGIVLYEMVTGKVPFQADTPLGFVKAHSYKQVPKIKRKIPSYLGEIIYKCLEKRPDDRYGSVKKIFDFIKLNNKNTILLSRKGLNEGDDKEEELSIIERPRWKIYIVFTVILIAVALVFTISEIFERNNVAVNTLEEAIRETEEPSEEERITVPESLELGQDINIIMACAGEDLNEPDVSSIVFTSYYSASGETRSLCMPVKTLMDVPGIGAELIGRSVEIGGMDLLSLTLEKGLGMDMEIDHYLLMDIKSVVGKLGGIELSLDQAYSVKNYTDSTTFSLKPGVNLLDGDETQNMLKYFSGIEENIPIEDIKIQKKIIDTIITGIVGSDDEQLTNNINLVKDYIDSDLSLEELLKLFSTFSKIEAGKNMVYALGVSSTTLTGEGIVYLPDVANLSNLFNKNQTQEEVINNAERTITVTILNGVGTPGIGDELRDILNTQVYESGKARFNILETGNADNFNYSESEIAVYSANESIVMTAANDIRKILNTGNITTKEEEVVGSDIVIILGADYEPDSIQDVVPVELTGIVKMVILNGEGTAKLALTVQGILEDHFNKGEKIIEVVETGDADNWGHTQTEIIRYTDDEGIEAFAQQVQERLGDGVIKKSDNNIDDVDITVIIGSDYTNQ